MTTQELFDKVVNHLLTQKAKSTVTEDQTGTCLYRSTWNGKQYKCAVGALITDDYYKESLECATAQDEKVIKAVESSLDKKLSRDEKFLLTELQGIHDSHAILAWPQRLKAAAMGHGLLYNPAPGLEQEFYTDINDRIGRELNA